LFSVGLRKFGKNPLMIELDQKHQKLHALVKQILDLKRSGKVEQAETEYAAAPCRPAIGSSRCFDELAITTTRKAA
jgi:hypothetical protein